MSSNPHVIGRLRTRFAGRLAALFVALLVAAPLSVRAAEAETALYWQILRGGEPAGYLLGTIHSEDPRVLDFPEPFIDQLTSNSVFAMEMVPDLETLNRLTAYMHYPDGTTLEDKIGQERFVRVMAALSRYQVPEDWKARMKIWAAMMTLSLPPPETGFFMDFSLSLRAAGSGMRVIGLETLEDQLSFLENMSEEQQLQLLDQALDDYEQVTVLHDRMVDDYLSGDLSVLQQQSDEQMAELDDATRSYFLSQGINARNRRMVDTLLPLLESDTVFVAVGALHLPGEVGLIALLRAAGYEMRPMVLPMLAPET